MFGKGNVQVRSVVCVERSILFRLRWTAFRLTSSTHLNYLFYSDVFEVVAFIKEEQPTLESLDEDKEDLDKLIESMFQGSSDESLLDDDQQWHTEQQSKQDDDDEFTPAKLYAPKSARRVQCTQSRRRTLDLGRSAPSYHYQKPNNSREQQEIVAMKCLRPQIRSDAQSFMVGVEDLVHETALLASLDHPNIIKLHGRAAGSISNSSRLGDGYFILIDLLRDTLEERIDRWRRTVDAKKKAPPLSQIRVACSLADVMSYLHSRNIAFRDLKPANVGFDSTGVLKLFDFGFAMQLMGSNTIDASERSHALYDKCGTPRYMAPEVGLEIGYDLSADVYSLGILLWEIFSLKKPFGNIKSAKEFHTAVFENGARPKVPKHWSKTLNDVIPSCWSSFPNKRPQMSEVKSKLMSELHTMQQQQQQSQQNNSNGAAPLRRSIIRRISDSL